MSGPLGSAQWMYATGAEVTQQSLKFNDDESQYLSWTPAAAGNRKTWTWSGWVKRGNIKSAWTTIFASASGSQYTTIGIKGSGADTLRIVQDNGAGGVYELLSSAVLRDTSAWYHIVVAMDTTQATSSDRIKFYINGEQQSVTGSYPSQNLDTWISNTQDHYLGGWPAVSEFVDGYLSDVQFIDGQALDATSFGETVDGYWKAKDYAGSYGTNGFHLTFEDDVVSEGFNCITYRGTGAEQSLSGLGFSPDLVWFKRRTASGSHRLIDSVRGATKNLASNLTNAEATSSDMVLSFDADGVTIGTNTAVNNAEGHVCWAWDAGTDAPASNTDGSITSTVKANPDYGFSIVSYTGTGANATVGHGLSAAPEVLIVKNRDVGSGAGWSVYHAFSNATPEDYTLLLDSTTAAINTSLQWNDTAPTPNVFTVGTENNVNDSGRGHIAYCFHSVAGYSSIGSYSGTGASGNAVTGLGFKPAFLMVKRTDSTSNWAMYDNTRSTTDPRRKNVWANLSDFEYDNSAYDIDFDADGFTLQTSDSQRNASGGTYIYMAFADTREAAFWKDVSGQGNHWTPNNLDYRDSLIDSPANNFSTLNVLNKYSGVTLSEGNLTAKGPDAAWRNVDNTIHMSSGKWYWEVYINNVSTYQMHGIVPTVRANGRTDFYADLYPGTYSDEWGYRNNGYLYNSASPNTSWGSTYTTGDVLGFALDMDAGTLDVTKNGVSAGSQITGISGTYRTCATLYGSSSKASYNFGQDSTFSGAKPMGAFTDDNSIGNFQYAPPAGYLALCTANLPTPTIIDGSEHFNTVLYTGNGSTNAITGVGFDLSSDGGLVWIKNRTSGYSHGLYDTVRGTGTTKSLSSNITGQEGFYSSYHNLVSFDSDGFTLGSTSLTNGLNASGQSHVAWNWKAGGTAVSNTDGSITSQVSANTDAGFSIVSYTGTGNADTVGHGLSSTPELIITKQRSSSNPWPVNSGTLFTSGNMMFLDRTDGQVVGGSNALASYSNTTFGVAAQGATGAINDSGETYIAYCFHNSDVCKIGSYTGNGSSTNGPMVYTGTAVSWVMFKCTSISGSQWIIYDAVRDSFNPVDNYLGPNRENAEGVDSVFDVDFTANGFKIRNSDIAWNTSGASYMYLAFGQPFKYANAR